MTATVQMLTVVQSVRVGKGCDITEEIVSALVVVGLTIYFMAWMVVFLLFADKLRKEK